MNKVSLVIVSVGTLVAGTTIADDYTCADFVTDTRKLTNGPGVNEVEGGYQFAVSRGVIKGIFAANQRTPLAGPQDQTQEQFRHDVTARCSSHPDETVEDAALTVAGLLPDASEYRSLSPIDFNLSKSALIGTKVSLSGDLSVSSNSATLYSDTMNTNSIKIDIGKLAREDREYISENCTGLCQITINGTVSKIDFSEGLKAESIDHD